MLWQSLLQGVSLVLLPAAAQGPWKAPDTMAQCALPPSPPTQSPWKHPRHSREGKASSEVLGGAVGSVAVCVTGSAIAALELGVVLGLWCSTMGLMDYCTMDTGSSLTAVRDLILLQTLPCLSHHVQMALTVGGPHLMVSIYCHGMKKCKLASVPSQLPSLLCPSPLPCLVGSC